MTRRIAVLLFAGMVILVTSTIGQNSVFSVLETSGFYPLPLSENILPQNSINCFHQDVHGYMWFGTQIGITRWDGREAKSYSQANLLQHESISEGQVNCFYEDRKHGFLWIGTAAGLSRINTKDNYRCEKISSFENQSVLYISKERNGLIVITNDAVWRYEGSKKISILNIDGDSIKTSSRKYRLAVPSSNGAIDTKLQITAGIYFDSFIVLGTNHGAIFHNLEGGSIVDSNNTLLLRNKLQSRAITSLLYDSVCDKLYIGTRDSGLSIFNIVKDKITFSESIDNLSKFIPKCDDVPGVSSLFKDSKGRLWIGTDYFGLVGFATTQIDCKIDRSTKTWQRRMFDEPFSLSSNRILSIFESRDSVLWIGTNGQGINILQPRGRQIFTHHLSRYQDNQWHNNDVWSIYHLTKDIVIVGTDGNGIREVNLKNKKERWIPTDKSLGFKAKVVSALSVCNKTLLVGTRDGLFKLDPNNLNVLKSRVSSIKDPVRRIHADSIKSEKIIVSCFNGFIYVLNAKFQITRKFKVSKSDATVVVEDFFTDKTRGYLYAASRSGLYKISLDSLLTGSFEKVRLLYDGNIVSAKVISLLGPTKFEDELWLGTIGLGVIRYSLVREKVIDVYTTKQGLPDNTAYGLLNDGNGNIWISTNHGLSKFDNKTSKFSIYNLNAGLQQQEFNTGAYHYNDALHPHQLFFGGINGFNSFNPINNSLVSNDLSQISIRIRTPDNLDTTFYYSKDIKSHEIELLKNFGSLDFSVSVFDYSDLTNQVIDYAITDNQNTLAEKNLKFSKLKNGSFQLSGKDLSVGENFLVIRLKVEGATIPETKSFHLILYKSRLWWLYNMYEDIPGSAKYLIIALIIASIIIVLIVFMMFKRRSYRLSRLLELQHAIALTTRKNELKLLVQGIAENFTVFFESNYVEIYGINYINNKCQRLGRIEGNQFIHDDRYTIEGTLQQVKIINLRDGSVEVQIDGKIVSNASPLEAGHWLWYPIVQKSYDKIGVSSDSNLSAQSWILGLIKISRNRNLFSKPKRFLQRGAFDNKFKRHLVDLYLDQIAISFNRLILMQWKNVTLIKVKKLELKAMNTQFEHSDRISVNQHREFLSDILEFVTKRVGVEKADISLLPLWADGAWLPENPVTYPNSFSEELKRIRTDSQMLPNGREGVFNLAIKTKKAILVYDYDDETDKVVRDHLIKGLSEVKSQLSVPIVEGGVSIGVINLYSEQVGAFNMHQAEELKFLVEPVSAEYFKVREVNAIQELVKPLNVFSDANGIFQPIISSIQLYLGAKHISIWRRGIDVENNRSVFNLVSCNSSDSQILPYEDLVFTNEIIEDVIEYNAQNRPINAILSEKSRSLTNSPLQILDFSKHFSGENLSKYLDVTKANKALLMPITINEGKDWYGFISVLISDSSNISLKPAEVSVLHQVARKSYMTLQTSSLIDFFKDISGSFLHRRPEYILKLITDKALDLLNADPVILFQCSVDSSEILFRDATFSYLKEFNTPEISKSLKDSSDAKVHLAEMVMNSGSEFFQDKKSFDRFCTKYQREHKVKSLKHEFWVKEGIQSMAAIHLKHDEESLGVLFVNYRKQTYFSDDLQKAIESFADLASATMMMNRYFEKSQKFILANIRMTDEAKQALAMTGSLHDISKRFDGVMRNMEIWENTSRTNPNRNTRIDVGALIQSLKPSIESLKMEIDDISEMWKPNTNLTRRLHTLSDIIDTSLSECSGTLRKNNIKPSIKHDLFDGKTSLGSLRFECDKTYIVNVLNNLITNAVDATGARGNLEISSKYLKDNGWLAILVTDNGPGVDPKVRDRIMRPYVTTKKNGNGLGLAISELIVSKHGGQLTFYRHGDKTTFKVTIPINLEYLDEK